MANFCTNCWHEIRKEDKFCTNCGYKVRTDNNFCTNCGTKLRKEDNFCTNCGTKIDRSDINQNNTILKSVHNSIEKKKAEEKKTLKTIDEIFESEEIKSKIRENKIDQIHIIYIKDLLKNKLISKKEKMSDEEIKYFITTELEKARKEQEKARITKEKEITNKKIENNKRIRGGYCGLGCRHFYEEFLDGGGAIVGDFDSDGYVEYYCHLGHSISFGCYCEDYE